MIKILNANNMVKIIKYFNDNKAGVYFPENLESLLDENHLQLRNMVFNQFIIPIAEIADSNILKLALFDFRYYNTNSEFIVLMCGDIEKDFLDRCYKKLIDADYSIKKLTVKFLFSNVNENILDILNEENFDNELEIKIGSDVFYQFSSFYD